jgi:hypothetical protein
MGSLNVYEKNKVIFFLCDCHSEVLVIEYDKELGLADLSVYENRASYKHKLSFWQRFRHIWHIIVRGTPYSDQILLNKNQIKELKTFLNALP